MTSQKCDVTLTLCPKTGIIRAFKRFDMPMPVGTWVSFGEKIGVEEIKLVYLNAEDGSVTMDCGTINVRDMTRKQAVKELQRLGFECKG